MRKFSTLALLSLVLYSIFSSQVGGAAPSGDLKSDNSNGELVDIKANLVYPHKLKDGESVLCLVGDFAAQHNGAVITADSAVRYDDERLECFGNVLINKNTTYAYCDRVDYDSQNNLATLYSPLVKVVDEDVTLYTYNFSFNTLNNIGRYWGGGVTIKLVNPTDRDSLKMDSLSVDSLSVDSLEIAIVEPGYDIMESSDGYYYADTKDVVGVGAVELQGEGYLMISDSVIYNMASDQATFFKNSNIWSDDGDYLYGDAGLYSKELDLYSVTESGYLLTDEQEAWGDSLEYYKTREEAILRRNIQIVDTTNKTMAFGDYAQYWGKIERVLLTRDPLVINYDTQQPEQPIDSLYLRGDTIEMISYVNGTGPFTDSLKMAQNSFAIPEGMAEMMMSPEEMAYEYGEEYEHPEHHEDEGEHDHNHEHPEHHEHEIEPTPTVDTLPQEVEAVVVDTMPTKKELKSIARKEKEAARVSAMEAREYRKLEERREKLIARVEKRRESGKNAYSDSMTLLRIVAEIESYNKTNDTLKDSDIVAEVAPMEQDTTEMDSTPERDSLYRVVLAYGDVRSFRSDFQMVCDSLVSNSFDTVMNLYTKPIVWSGKNQITADKMDFYTLEGAIDYADFIGNPIMASLVIEGDTTYINQVKGKEMRAFFEDNNVRRNDVNSNVQTIYYMQDEETQIVNTIAYIESGSATFLIENQELDGIIYRQKPTYTFAPLERRPMDIPLFLPGFEWEAELRPTRNKLLNRAIRPSVREEVAEIAKPQFPIKAKIESEKLRLIESKQWQDRIEHVSPDAADWMRSLGFTPGLPREEGSFEF
ncbi:MAG: OstA-like protein [Rikenellaceae bacterium]